MMIERKGVVRYNDPTKTGVDPDVMVVDWTQSDRRTT
jgi:hypothetical protein